MTIKIYESYNKEKPQMFFGEGRGLQEFVNTPYPEFLKLKDKQRDQDWAHDEFNLSKDAQQLNDADQATSHIFTSNLQSQIFADTVQGRGPASLLPYVSDPSLEAMLIEWSRSECLHSRSYSHMLTSMYSNPSLVINMIERKPEIFVRFKQCTEAYDTFFNNPTKENLVLLMAAVNILEGLAFYASFACNFSFANTGIFEAVASFLTLIRRDEALHLAMTTTIIKNWKSGKDGKEWKEIWHDNVSKIKDMYLDGLQGETVWNKYLFKFGTPIATLNEQVLNDYNEYQTHLRMKALGLKLSTKVTKDPLPWINLKYVDQSNTSKAPQETQLTHYVKDPINYEVKPKSNSVFNITKPSRESFYERIKFI